jgi:hypothetical protein
MKRDKKSLVAYVAGLIDGEGCITCSYVGKTRIMTRLQIWMTTPQWVDIVVGLFGGIVRMTVNEKQGRPAYIWTLGDMYKMKKALKTLLPFLRVKKNEAELAIRLIDRKIVGLKRGRIKGMWGGTEKLSEHEQQKRHELSDSIAKCKQFNLGIPKCISKDEHKRIRAAVENKRFDNGKTSSTLKLCSDPDGIRKHQVTRLNS